MIKLWRMIHTHMVMFKSFALEGPEKAIRGG
jgi:hypothetical protein